MQSHGQRLWPFSSAFSWGPERNRRGLCVGPCFEWRGRTRAASIGSRAVETRRQDCSAGGPWSSDPLHWPQPLGHFELQSGSVPGKEGVSWQCWRLPCLCADLGWEQSLWECRSLPVKCGYPGSQSSSGWWHRKEEQLVLVARWCLPWGFGPPHLQLAQVTPCLNCSVLQLCGNGYGEAKELRL